MKLLAYEVTVLCHAEDKPDVAICKTSQEQRHVPSVCFRVDTKEQGMLPFLFLLRRRFAFCVCIFLAVAMAPEILVDLEVFWIRLWIIVIISVIVVFIISRSIARLIVCLAARFGNLGVALRGGT
jgi:hypothetical protein